MALWRTVTGLDYETDTNHSIRLKASDQFGAMYYKDFIVTVTNVVEDLDLDGIEIIMIRTMTATVSPMKWKSHTDLILRPQLRREYCPLRNLC